MTAPALIKTKNYFKKVHLIPDLRTSFSNSLKRSGSGSGLRKNAGSGFNLSGSATLEKRDDRLVRR